MAANTTSEDVNVLAILGAVRASSRLLSSSSSSKNSLARRLEQARSRYRRYRQKRSKRKATLLLSLSILLMYELRPLPQSLWVKFR